MPIHNSARPVAVCLLILVAAAALLATGQAGAARRLGTPHVANRFTSRAFASAATLSHPTASGHEALAKPDDITSLGGDIYVGFQNGVGPQGEPSATGNRDSTIVEFNRGGHRVAQWDVVGKCDGLTGDPALHAVIATVNEDAHSSLYLIAPGHRAIHMRYSRPLPSRGGSDAISIDRGTILISASAPGTTGAQAPRAAYPAVYRATLHLAARVVTLRPLFSDEAMAKSGSGRVRLALTDPDSSEIVPAWAQRFAGDFMLTSQGDEQQIFRNARGRLSVLKLSASVDDTAWPSAAGGTLYATNTGAGTIDRITGPFRRGSVLVAATPCDESNAPSTCPAPGFPANYLGVLDPRSGMISRAAVGGAPLAPQGLLFMP
ncbi:MAG: hypothetical protein WBQ18_08435 [Solirubrobacteraceae bacterium]